jgi:hypothetical protein
VPHEKINNNRIAANGMSAGACFLRQGAITFTLNASTSTTNGGSTTSAGRNL